MPTRRSGRGRSSAPRSPTYFCQPSVTPASIESRAATDGRQDRVAVGLRLLLEELPARHRHDARRDRPRPRASRAPDGELQLGARRDQEQPGLPAARLRQDVGAARDVARRPSGPAPAGSGGRGRGRRGPRGARSRPSTPRAVSLASAGRMIARCGIARSDIRCSTGWWVGPSSPRPIESCVQTKIVGSSTERGEADRRTHVVGEAEERRDERAARRRGTTCRWRSRPSRARARRSGCCCRRRSARRSPACPRASSSSTRRGPRRRRGARAPSWRSR